MSPRTSLPAAAFAALLLTMAIGAIGFGIAIPMLPSYAKAFGVGGWEVGLVFAIFSVGQAIGEATWGRLSDRLGRKPLLLATLGLTVAGYVGMAIAPTFVACLAARLVCGLGAGSGGVVQALIVDISLAQRRTANLALAGACTSIGLIIGPAMGGMLSQPDLGLAGFRPVFMLATALSLVGIVVIWAGVPLSAVPRPADPALDAPAPRLSSSAIGLILVSVGLMGAFAGLESIFGLAASHRFGWSPRDLGLVFAFAGLTGALAQFLVTGRAVHRFGDRRVLIVGLFLTAASLLGQAFAPTGWIMAALVGFVPFGLSLALPTSASLLSLEVPPSSAGRALGSSMAAGAIARILGPIAAGLLYSGVSPTAPFLAGGLMVLGTVALAGARRTLPVRTGGAIS